MLNFFISDLTLAVFKLVGKTQALSEIAVIFVNTGLNDSIHFVNILVVVGSSSEEAIERLATAFIATVACG